MVLLEYIPGNTLFHRLDVRSKLIWLIMVVTLAFLFSDVLYVGTVFIFVIVCLAIAKIPLKRLAPYFKMLTIPLIFIVGYEALVYPGEQVLAILPWGIRVTLEGLLMGLTFMFRLLIMVLASTVFTFTTPYDHMLSLLVKLHTPYPIVFMLLVGLRFAPLLQREAAMIIDAQKARGAELEKWSGFKQTIKTYIPIMIPMLVNGLRRSQQLAMAMVARGFESKGRWMPIEEIKMKPLDYVFTFIVLVLFALGVYLYIQGYGVVEFWR